MSGGVLLSHNLSVAVPSALKGLTSGFGMGPGVSRFAMAAVTLSTSTNHPVCCQKGVGLLVGNCLVDANQLRGLSRPLVGGGGVRYVCAWVQVLVWFCTV